MLELTGQERAAHASIRWFGPLMAGATLLVLGFALARFLEIWQFVSGKAQVGGDLVLYLGATRSWLAGHSFYPPAEIAGPFAVGAGSILYPPTAILLFLPWLALPVWTFAAIPLCIVWAAVWYHRSASWTWPLMALCLAQSSVLVKIVYDNPVLWIAAAVALGTVRGGWAVAVVVKPTLLPFALVGARRRAWWVCLAAFGTVSLLFLPLWSQYVAVLADARDPRGLLYSLGDAPLLMVPVLALVGGRRSPFRGSIGWMLLGRLRASIIERRGTRRKQQLSNQGAGGPFHVQKDW